MSSDDNIPRPLPAGIAARYVPFTEGKNCRVSGCHAPLSAGVFMGYKHPNGEEIPEFEYKVWVYLKCPRCGHGWSLWKVKSETINFS